MSATPTAPSPAEGSSKPPKQQRGPPPNIQPRPKLSKAERRELQEKQRATNAANAAANGNAKGGAQKGGSTPAKQSKEPKAARPSVAPIPSATVVPRNAKPATASVVSDPDSIRQRDLRIFSHFGFPSKPSREANSSHSKVDIHPAILRLALQFSEFRIVGANARCIATVTALKHVIQDYTTPPGTTLSRHLMTHLSPQISHLTAARPMSTSTGNAIRFLKYEISILNIDLPEQDAKQYLCDKLDDYIRDKIFLADVIIRNAAIAKMRDGEVILTYARSSIVEKILLDAKTAGKEFSVVVVDSGPLFEGKRLLASLTAAGIKCTYSLLSALGTIMPSVSLIFLGAHALHANGSLYARAGTALVAMMAKQRNVPVLACCETYKFSPMVPFDGFTKNELAPNDLDLSPTIFLNSSKPTPQYQALRPLYDLTPSDAISAVVTELGMIPPSSVPTVLLKHSAEGLMDG